MKDMNLIKFTVEATTTFNELLGYVRGAKNYSNAKQYANRALGFIDCAATVINASICTENNDFTGSFDSVLDDWAAKVYQAMGEKAQEEGRLDRAIKYFQTRDKWLESAKCV